MSKRKPETDPPGGPPVKKVCREVIFVDSSYKSADFELEPILEEQIPRIERFLSGLGNHQMYSLILLMKEEARSKYRNRMTVSMKYMHAYRKRQTGKTPELFQKVSNRSVDQLLERFTSIKHNGKPLDGKKMFEMCFSHQPAEGLRRARDLLIMYEQNDFEILRRFLLHLCEHQRKKEIKNIITVTEDS